LTWKSQTGKRGGNELGGGSKGEKGDPDWYVILGQGLKSEAGNVKGGGKEFLDGK